MKRVIGLPNGKQVSLPVYIASWKTVKSLLPKTQVRGFSWFAVPAAEILRELRAGIHDRINRHDPAYGKGRKWDHNWQRETGHFARAVNTPRLIVRWAPPDFRTRLASRLTTETA